MQSSQATKISVLVPMRNEELYIGPCLASLLRQTISPEFYEVIVLDGRSSDRSKEIVQDLRREHRNLHWVENPGAIVPAAMNIGISIAKGAVIVRADAHTLYPSDYLDNCVKYLKSTGADNVGGPVLTVPANKSLGARLVAAVLTNPFGVGDSHFRIGLKEGFVDTVPFGVFRRELFDRVGMYNEKLVRNQDNELNARIRMHGGKIYQTPALTTEYHPVAAFRDLLRQTFKQSQWHVFSVIENAASMSFRHFVPAVCMLVVLLLAALSVSSPWAARFLIELAASYFVVGLLFAATKAWKYGLSTVCVLPFAFACFHLAYGSGTWAGLRYAFAAPARRPIRAGQPVE